MQGAEKKLGKNPIINIFRVKRWEETEYIK